METEKERLKRRLNDCREYLIETTKFAGVTKALNELASQATGDKRYFLKILFTSSFRNLLTNLFVLTNDSNSKPVLIIDKLIKDFERLFGARLKELGLEEAIMEEKQVQEKLSASITVWESTRHEFAAHFNSSPADYRIDQRDISNFLISACKLIDEMNRTISIPVGYPKEIKQVIYNSQSAINLEEESYQKVLESLKWI